MNINDKLVSSAVDHSQLDEISLFANSKFWNSHNHALKIWTQKRFLNYEVPVLQAEGSKEQWSAAHRPLAPLERAARRTHDPTQLFEGLGC